MAFPPDAVEADILSALGFFSRGVEVGHFSFVAMTLLLIAAAAKWVVKLTAWSWRIPPYAIGSVASYWLIARIAAFCRRPPMSLVYLTNIKVNSRPESNNYGLFLSDNDLYVFSGTDCESQH